MKESLYDYCMAEGKMTLLMQWDTDANLPLTPKSVTTGSSRKVWWYCEKGHRWQQAIWVRVTHGTGCQVCAGKTVVEGVNDFAALEPEIAAEWHPTKNGALTPTQIPPFTHRKVWWQCANCGHEWQAEVKSRTGIKRTGCPVCTNRTVVPGINDLASQFPEIAKEFHPIKNTGLRASSLTAGSAQRVWWQCSTCGHEWRATVTSRTNGSGCPVCAGKTVLAGVNDFASQCPSLAAEWHPTKNGTLTPEQVTAQSNRTVWWTCPNGHDYHASVSSRVSRGSGCPICANRKVLVGFNDLATRSPDLAAEWHPILNGALRPTDVTCGSSKKVWWCCSTCGHEWQALVYSRAGKSQNGCPMCAGKVNMAKRKYYDNIVAQAETGYPLKPRRRPSPIKNNTVHAV